MGGGSSTAAKEGPNVNQLAPKEESSHSAKENFLILQRGVSVLGALSNHGTVDAIKLDNDGAIVSKMKI